MSRVSGDDDMCVRWGCGSGAGDGDGGVAAADDAISCDSELSCRCASRGGDADVSVK